MAVYSGAASNMNTTTLFLQNQTLPYSSSSSSQPFASLFTSDSPSFVSNGSRSMFSFEDVNVGKRSDRPFFCAYDQEDEDSDEYFHQPEKKRRLKVDQIEFLEKSFEEDNKLEPERKIQLAKDLGLQPRQIAIWFQNRRARYKTKQIEKDYDVLQASYNSLKADYDDLLKEKEKLKAEVHSLTDRLLLGEREKGKSEYIEDLVCDSDVSKKDSIEAMRGDFNSAERDVLDASSGRPGNGIRSPCLLEPVDSSYVYQHDQSDVSQGEDNWSRSMLRPPLMYAFEKIEDGVYSVPRANSCQFGCLDDDNFGF